MYRLEELLDIAEFVTNTKQKRHIVGGVLMSFSILFGGLALTTFLIKEEYHCEDIN